MTSTTTSAVLVWVLDIEGSLLATHLRIPHIGGVTGRGERLVSRPRFLRREAVGEP